MGFLSDVGLGFLDSGSSSASVSSTVNLDVKGLDNIKETIVLGGATTINENIELKPVTLELKPVTLNENIELKPVTLNENVELKPVTLNENVDLKPVTLNENIDLKPVAVDTCQTYRLAPLPDTDVCQPYRHHVAYTLFGVEYWTVTYDGESNQRIKSPRHPQVVGDVERGIVQHRRPSDGVGRGIRVRVVETDEH